MVITFWNSADDPRMLTKAVNSLNAVKEIQTAKPYQPLSPLTGQIIIDYDAAILNCNYCAFLGKYHFITDMQMLTGQKMAITCRVDVLQTYNAAIKNTRAYCKRTASRALQTPYLYDNSAPISEKKFVAYNEEGSNICAHSSDMILLTVG